MKKHKMHIISILLIVFMLIFALATSYNDATTTFEIKNNASLNIKISILYRDRTLPDAVAKVEIEHLIGMGESISMSIRSGNNIATPPSSFILRIVIYDENENILIEYNEQDIYENVIFKQTGGGGRLLYFKWEIEDNLWE